MRYTPARKGTIMIVTQKQVARIDKKVYLLEQLRFMLKICFFVLKYKFYANFSQKSLVNKSLCLLAHTRSD